MKGAPSCPRCGGPLHEPGLLSSQWRCDQHGSVHPLQRQLPLSSEALAAVARRSAVPVWVPWPLPPGWLVTGFAFAGDERTGARATVVAVSGPAPLGGPGDLLLVAEEPGVGLGARFAGISGPDPGPLIDGAPPATRVDAAGDPTALWELSGDPDRCVYAGEALGQWLWAICWPETGGLLVQDHLALVDLRDAGHPLDLPIGAPTPRLG